MSIDPAERLAFSLTDSPGTYALLLGSGISSAAMIPTGWRIIEDLILRIARMRGDEEEASEDPAAWYSEHFQREPSYSDLVEELGHTNAERQGILDRYIEPDEQDRENGSKQPTAAHKAIAKMAKMGVIRIIITTNFDRLLENALAEQQVPLAVVGSPDDIEGMQPLSHSQGLCQVIKLHGDYKDTRILNTEEELKQYDERTDRLLDRILDEFGMVVCGWSGDWDIALRKAIRRCSTRRFGWYWTHRGETGEVANQIIQLRDAQGIPIEGADSFFTSLLSKVETLHEHRKPHPDSTALAVAMLKRFLPRPEDRIRLTDLITQKTQTAADAIRTAGEIQASERQKQADASAAACETLTAMAATAGYWMDERHQQDWLDSLETLLNAGKVWHQLKGMMRAYGASLVFWSLCTGALARNQLDTVRFLFDAKVKTGWRRLPIIPVWYLYPPEWGLLGNVYQHTTDNLVRTVGHFTYEDAEKYKVNIDKFDIIWHAANAYRKRQAGDQALEKLMQAYQSNHLRVSAWENSPLQMIQEFKQSIETAGYESPFVKIGLLGATPQEALWSLDFVQQNNQNRLMMFR